MFKGCTALTSIDLPDSLTWLGYTETFANTGLTSIKIPAGVTGLCQTSGNNSDKNTSLFSGCTSLTTVILPAGISDFGIGGKRFSKIDSALTTIKVGEDGENNVLSGVTLLGTNAFESAGIESLSLPNLTSIGASAFTKSKVKSVSLPQLTTLANSLFASCTSLTQVVLNDNAEALGNSMFEGCTALKTITLPSNLTHLGKINLQRQRHHLHSHTGRCNSYKRQVRQPGRHRCVCIRVPELQAA